MTTPAAQPYTLNGLVERAASLAPERLAVRCAKDTLSYAALDALAEKVRNGLVAMGVRRGDRVGLFAPKSVRAVASLLGILKTGASYVPIDPMAPTERARFILGHAGARALVAGGRPLRMLAQEAGTDAPLVPSLLVTDGTPVLQGVAKVVRSLDEVFPELESAPEPVHQLDQDLAYVLYTSGSTGTPKGVAITHAQSLTFVRAANQVFELGPEDVVASHAPFNFDLSVIDLFCTFAAGACIELIPETWTGFPTKVAQLLSDAQVSVWNSVPSALVQLTTHGQLEKRDLSKLRLVMFAGERYPPQHLRVLREMLPGARLLNVYGQTEANSSTYFEVRSLPASDDFNLPVGRPFPNYEVLLIDDGGGPVDAVGTEGEIYVVSGAVASGYFGDEERTRRAFVPHPLSPGRTQIVYRTGDRGYWDADGNLCFAGRRDLVVKCRGFRVEIEEVETVARAFSRVKDVTVVPLPDDQHGHVLVMFVVTAGAIEIGALQEHLTRSLPRYMLPEGIFVLPAMPRTTTGKTDRALLVADARQRLSRGDA